MKSYKLLIGGKEVNSSSGETFIDLNPTTEKPIAKFQKGNEQDVKKAITAAENSYFKWSRIPAPKRGELLFKIAIILEKNKERLSRLLTIEMGKVLPEARGDVQEAIDIFRYMGGEGRRLFGHTTPSELQDKFCMTIRRPIGVVGLIAPWNFPIAIPAWKIAPALICGNSIVFKPASDTPLCALELVKICYQAGVPKDVINFVTGPGSKAGAEIVSNKKIRAISFTGSKQTGEHIMKNAGLKKVGLELGGKNGIIIMDDANISLAVDGVIWGGFGTTGQRCTAASRVIVHKRIKEKFQRALVNRIKKLRLGSGLLTSTDVGPLINKSAVEKTHKYTQIGLEEGAKLLCGGKPKTGSGFFYTPTLFTDVQSDMRIAQEEIFGPSVSIIEVKSLNKAIEISNSIEYGLSSAIYTENISNAFKAAQEIEAGLTYINSSTIGSEVHLPFGGVKSTGNTREAGIEGIHEFSETKTIYFDYSGRLQKAQIDDR